MEPGVRVSVNPRIPVDLGEEKRGGGREGEGLVGRIEGEKKEEGSIDR